MAGTLRIASDIDWDTDGIDPKELDLPSIVEIPAEIIAEGIDIADYLSDEYGWCVKGFVLDRK